MFNRFLLLCLVIMLGAVGNAYAAPAHSSLEKIDWVDWSDEAFARAAKEKRLVLLDLEAVWCHWCHVMQEETYGNPAVIEIINKNFVAIRVDQAARPDLAARYEDYGWPATVILNAQGQDLWKEAGFIEPDIFAAQLKKVLAQPQPQKPDSNKQYAPPAADGLLSVELKQQLRDGFQASRDTNLGGLLGVHRYIRSDAVEYVLMQVSLGDEQNKEWISKTLTAGLKLLDPAWGGLYQYSTKSGWDSPHFEKIMSTQARGLESYVAGYQVLHDEAYLTAAKSIRNYVKEFLTSPEGAFYASQDADLVKGQHSAEYFALGADARRAKGIPEVQKQIFTRENAWMISALISLYAVTADPVVLADAVTAVKYIQAQRALPGGGFKHGEADNGGPFLGDNLAMLQAFLNLYRATADRAWLQSAVQTGNFIIANFIDGSIDATKVGVVTAKRSPSPLYQAVYSTEENINLARAANSLFQYTGKPEFRTLAEVALRYASQPHVALEYKTEPSLIVADIELRADPLHVTIVAQKDDEKGRELFLAGNLYYAPYKRLEWWDKREGDLPRSDVTYPQLSKAAGFVCTNKRCSLPIFDGAKLAQTIERFRTTEKRG